MTENNTIYAPFEGIIPSPTYAKEVIAPPYDVLSSEEAKIQAKDKSNSFLHISKAEIDFEEPTSPYEEKVYRQASANFQRMLEKGILQKWKKACYYVYQMEMGTHKQTGIVVSASVKSYNEGRIKRHELTRIVKENDRVKQIRSVGAQTGPALLINKELPEIKQLLNKITSRKGPYISVIGDNNVRHSLWIIDEDEEISQITTAFAKQNEAYIADGHHRSAAASRLASEDGTSETARFLAVTFFADEMKIWDYNRFVHDLGGLSIEGFKQAIEKEGFSLRLLSPQKKPEKKGDYTMYLDGKWYLLSNQEKTPSEDPVSKLDVSILSERILNKILNITDLRNDERIEFIGGIRGAEEIEKLVNEKQGSVGFMLYPTSVEELIAVADKKMLMPPKSTWFEPKLADGIVSKPNNE